ncbi:MAG TPA: hypothetical protein VLG13_03040, partial [Patescibacteria group bacterium]|nr:hypothetical protein [Patescibacteria group bacterium]
MAKKPIIAVDIDEVLFPLHEHFLKHHNEQYGTDFIFPDPEGRYYLNEFSGDNLKIIMRKLRHYYKSGETAHLQPLPGAIKAINKLHKRFDLVILSSQ